jgi:hypothetical protein
MAKKKIDLKAKAKRQKIIAGVGGVLLLGVLVIQVPRTMKMMNSGQTDTTNTPSSSSTASGTQALAPPSLAGGSAAASSTGGSAPAASATSADGVSDPTSPLPAAAGQLISFSHFQSKDPFKQQMSASCSSGTTAAGSCASASAPAGAHSAPSSVTPGTVVSVAKSGSAKATMATISLNGNTSTVTVGSTFPSGAPVFTLVSLTRLAAKVAIAGGTYENGAATVTLPKGKTVTLMNTADGTRYALRLVATA